MILVVTGRISEMFYAKHFDRCVDGEDHKAALAAAFWKCYHGKTFHDVTALIMVACLVVIRSTILIFYSESFPPATI